MKYQGYIFNKPFEDIKTIKSRKNLCYLDNYIALDTETSHNHNEETPECWIYQWAFAFNKGLYYGRRPEDLLNLFNKIIEYYQLNEGKRVLIYVHNLPYDFSYLINFLYRWYGNPTNVLATDNHHIFNVTYSCGLEFRCSYKLSNYSLDKWANNLGVKHKKLVGTIDYDIIRHQNTPLTKTDWKYMFYDVITLDECIERQLQNYNDTVKSIPLTSTGYTRRELRRSFKGNNHKGRDKNRDDLLRTRLDKKTYLLNRLNFSGGLSVGNLNYKGQIMKGRIRHRDFRSHYPTQLRVKTYPIGKWIYYSNSGTIEDYIELNKKYCILITIQIRDMELYRDITLPYAQTSHFIVRTSKGFKNISENGRIIATKGISEVVLSLEELELLQRQYKFTYNILEVWINKRGYLPEWLTSVIDTHFKGKTDYKDREKEYSGDNIEERLFLHNELMRSKAVINGVYGVFATDPIKPEYTLEGNKCTLAHTLSIEEGLDKYYKSHNSFAKYSVGVFCTIYARMQLVEVVENIVGYENFIYSDTDSIFYLTNDDIESKMQEYNKTLYQDAIEKNAYITTDKGNIINYNAFEDENEDITEFKFLHSKCYAYKTSDSKLHTVIAGVTAYNHKSKVTREKELGSIEELKEGKVFTECGGTKAKYIEEDIHIYNGNSTCGGCIITPTTKTLNSTDILDRDYIVKWCSY